MEIVLVVVGKCVTYAVCGLSVTGLGLGVGLKVC